MSPDLRRPQAQWKDRPLPSRAWKGRPGRSQAALSAEQDRAAGGRARRLLDLGDGRLASASIALRAFPKTRRIRAYLRWSDRGRTREKYVCEVHHGTRAENLTEAWSTAIDRKLVGTRKADTPQANSWASSPAVRSVMRGNRGKDTRPELALRSAVHRLGLRYRVGSRPIPTVRRTADMVFTRAKVAVFLDGCFWHGCPEHHRPAKRNGEFWMSKIEGNRRRDQEINEILADTGWVAVRVWEHEDPQEAATRVADVVRQRDTRRVDPGSGRPLKGMNGETA